MIKILIPGKKQYSKRFLSDLVEKYFAQEISEINGDVIVVDEKLLIMMLLLNFQTLY